ncbi:MAG TPA: DNA polymerase III subunit alpha [Gemmatimonadaceae bacterium]
MTDDAGRGTRGAGREGMDCAAPAARSGLPHPASRVPRPEYVELHCHSAFSLLDGASPPDVLVARAVALGYHALALTDHDDLGGIVAFAQAAHEAGVEGIVGVELTIAGRGARDAGCVNMECGEGTGERRFPSRSVSTHTRPAPLAPEPATHHLTLLAESRDGYANLATLVTRARMDRPRGRPAVGLDTLARHAHGLFALSGCPRGWVPSLVRRGDLHGAREAAATLADIFGGRLAIECWDHGLAEEREAVPHLIAIARALALPWVVTNDVHYAAPRDRIVHDVLAALRHQRTLDEMGTRLRPNGEWYLKSAAQMARRWRSRPEGIRATLAIAERCAFRMRELRPTLPAFPLPPGVEPDEYLARLVEQGAHERWGARRGERHDRQIAHELAVIRRLGLAGYFLIVWDIVRFARREGVLCQGRGSAANSAVCFCLGITAVDPIKLGLLFERFLSEERHGAPDIDIDFAHRDREKVLQYVYERYGRDHAAMVCEQISYRGRSAARDTARVLGFSVQQASVLATLVGGGAAGEERGELLPAGAGARDAGRGADAVCGTRGAGCGIVECDTGPARAGPVSLNLHSHAPRAPHPASRAGLDPADPRVRILPRIVRGLRHVPRHRSIHVGGFVLTEAPLSTVVPIEPAAMDGRTVVQWDKDDVDAMGLVKIDLLGLGMLTLIQDCLAYVRATRGHTVELYDLDYADQAVYDDLCRADTIGVFQVESRAQMITLPRLKPRCFYDLVVEVALIRPGPIQGEMVHPYLRRRAGEEPVTYPHPSLEPILARTLGIPLFQEQGMQVAIAAAGFTPGEADALRRAMGHKRSRERMAAICEKMIEGMRRNGIDEDTARRIYGQINAFADYGFPESHAASFALLVYASAYLKHYYAPEFTAAILNAQPMGFYSPGTIIEDARRHGVRVLGVDASRSRYDCTLERAERPGAPAVRLGLRLVKGLGARARERLEAALRETPFRSIGDVVRRSGLDRRALRALAEAGALDAFVPDEPSARRRRAAIWRMLEEVRGDAGPLAPTLPSLDVPASIPALSALELTAADYRTTGVSLNGHPMRHLRALLAPNGVRTARELAAMPDGARDVAVAGLVICRQRPGTAKGFAFLTLEDETGLANVVVTPKRFERQALLISNAPLLLVRGTLQVEQGVVNLRGETFRELKVDVGADGVRGHDFH